MSFSTLTRYLRLKIQTDLSQPASQNLARLDALGNTFNVGETDDLEVRSRGNIVLKPEATAVGGTGSGGEVHIGSSAQPVAVKFFATSFEVAGGAGSLLTEDSLNTVTNKSISGSLNLLSNIGYSSLLLANSIKNSDIAADAAIADTKLATIATPGKVNVSALFGSLSGNLLPSYSSNNGKYLSLVDGALSWSTVTIPPAGVTSFNGETGDVTFSAPVTSVNGQTGDVSFSIPDEYTDGMADSRADARIAAVRGQANGLASLDASGKLPTSQLPSLAITSTNVVANEAAMLALSAEEGDVAIRTDNGKTYILASSDPTSLASWKEITAGGAVTSVNGQTGTVSLSTTDVGEGTNLYYTSGRFDSAFAAKSTTDLTEGTNQYFTAARAKAAAVSNSGFINATDVAMSSALVRSFVPGQIDLLKGVSKSTWSGTNTHSIITGWGSPDVFFHVFDYATGEQIIPYSISWSGDNNTATLALPPGQVAGIWRVIASRL